MKTFEEPGQEAVLTYYTISRFGGPVSYRYIRFYDTLRALALSLGGTRFLAPPKIRLGVQKTLNNETR